MASREPRPRCFLLLHYRFHHLLHPPPVQQLHGVNVYALTIIRLEFHLDLVQCYLVKRVDEFHLKHYF